MQSTVQSIAGIDNQSIQTIERAQITLSVLFILTSFILWPTPQGWGGVLAGAVIAYFNFRILRRVVSKLVSAGETEKPAVSGFRFLVKMIGLMIIVGFLILKVEVDAMALLVGFSSIVMAIFYEGIKSYARI